MNVGVIIPVGPGHESLADRAEASVRRAWATDPGPFTDLAVVRVADPHGALGRSRARNEGLDATPADWHFLLDADDEMMPAAFGLVQPHVSATFGKILLEGRRRAQNTYPADHCELIRHGVRGTLTMGCFVRGDLGLRFDEALDLGEDFDFYMRLPDFVKVPEPLVSIGYDQPSACGPRGRAVPRPDWGRACAQIIARYHPEESRCASRETV